LLLAVVDVLLKVQNVVSGEKVAPVSALYNPGWGCGRSCCPLTAAHNERRRWRGGLGGINSCEAKIRGTILTCVFDRFLPRVLSVSVGVELEGSAAGVGSASAALEGPGSLIYGAVCS
jgi:hypothetical protein